jgi:hypothetical protein
MDMERRVTGENIVWENKARRGPRKLLLPDTNPTKQNSYVSR